MVKAPLNPINGWIILDKPAGISSAHAVAKVKRMLRPAKIGHAGTLDPLASGILPLALGEATKTVPYMMDTRKAYRFEVTWGEERTTDDLEGEVVESRDTFPEKPYISSILSEFIGDIQQQPPSYSAIKVDGQRAYAVARKGEAVELKHRQVTVHSLEMTGYTTDKSTFLCHCGKGTYIRSLARDMGRRLGCLGHISMLRRIQVGNFAEKHSISLEVLDEMRHKGDLSFVLPVESALDDIPAMEIDSNQAALLKSGQAILPTDQRIEEGTAGTLVLAMYDGKAIAIGERSQGKVKPVRVFNI